MKRVLYLLSCLCLATALAADDSGHSGSENLPRAEGSPKYCAVSRYPLYEYDAKTGHSKIVAEAIRYHAQTSPGYVSAFPGLYIIVPVEKRQWESRLLKQAAEKGERYRITSLTLAGPDKYGVFRKSDGKKLDFEILADTPLVKAGGFEREFVITGEDGAEKHYGIKHSGQTSLWNSLFGSCIDY